MAATYETSLTPTVVSFLAAGETENVNNVNAGSGANRVLLVHVGWQDRTNTITEVRYNGELLTPLGDKVTVSAVWSAQLFRRANPASGANTLAVTMGAGSADGVGMISAWVANSVNQTTPVDGYVTNTGSGATANPVSSVGVTSETGDRAVFFHLEINDSEAQTAEATNYTERQDAGNGGGVAVELGDADGAASITGQATWSHGAANWVWITLGVNVNAVAALPSNDAKIIIAPAA